MLKFHPGYIEGTLFFPCLSTPLSPFLSRLFVLVEVIFLGEKWLKIWDDSVKFCMRWLRNTHALIKNSELLLISVIFKIPRTSICWHLDLPSWVALNNSWVILITRIQFIRWLFWSSCIVHTGFMHKFCWRIQSIKIFIQMKKNTKSEIQQKSSSRPCCKLLKSLKNLMLIPIFLSFVE